MLNELRFSHWEGRLHQPPPQSLWWDSSMPHSSKNEWWTTTHSNVVNHKGNAKQKQPNPLKEADGVIPFMWNSKTFKLIYAQRFAGEGLSLVGECGVDGGVNGLLGDWCCSVSGPESWHWKHGYVCENLSCALFCIVMLQENFILTFWGDGNLQ